MFIYHLRYCIFFVYSSTMGFFFRSHLRQVLLNYSELNTFFHSCGFHIFSKDSFLRFSSSDYGKCVYFGIFYRICVCTMIRNLNEVIWNKISKSISKTVSLMRNFGILWKVPRNLISKSLQNSWYLVSCFILWIYFSNQHYINWISAMWCICALWLSPAESAYFYSNPMIFW